MFGRKRTFDSMKTNTDILGFLAEGNTLTGELALQGGFRVDGKVVGKVSSPSALVVGPSGVIEADELHVATLFVSGVVRGNLEVDERLEVHPGGRVYGRIRLARPGLVVAPGGLLEATLEMERHEVVERDRDERSDATEVPGLTGVAHQDL